MAASAFANSYAAQSLGLTPNVTGGLDIANVLKNQLAEQAKRRAQKNTPVDGMMSPAAFDLFGKTPGT